MSAVTGLPRWDMDVVYPGLDSPEFSAAFLHLDKSLGELEALCDLEKVDKGQVSAEPAAAFDRVVTKFNEVLEEARTVNAFVAAYYTTDSRSELAQARTSEMDSLMVRARKLGKRLTGWMGGMDIASLTAESPIAASHLYCLEKAVVGAQRLMSTEEESLASDLEMTGRTAWTKLHSNVTSQLAVTLTLDGETQTLPMSAVRALANDTDSDRRKAAFDAELAAWKTVEGPLASAMNSIKGEVGLLAARRGWESPLDEALFGSNIDRETLEAMMQAAHESFPDFRRYLRAKARALGQESLRFCDLFAPVGQSNEGQWDYALACDFVVEQFGGYSQKMADFASRSFRENWIDVPPAPGKVDGAYCMSLRGDESRILMNYEPSFGSVSTLAHELGHGYHNLCLSERTWLQRATPMTLAETASIFCETIIRQAVLENGSPQDQLVVLEGSLQGCTQVVVDITSRFLFEKSVFDARAKRELSAREMCELMISAQQQTYGDGLAADSLHPYMWAVKSHYYSGRSFYNFPYMFGLLFGLGVYAVYRNEPSGFHDRYDELLSSTGMADAAALGKSFGIDIRSVDFWRASLDQIRGDIDRFEKLV